MRISPDDHTDGSLLYDELSTWVEERTDRSTPSLMVSVLLGAGADICISNAESEEEGRNEFIRVLEIVKEYMLEKSK